MPQPIVYQKDRGLIQGILGASEALAGGLEKRAENQKLEQERQRKLAEEQKQNTILGDVLKQWTPESTPMQKAEMIIRSPLTAENKKLALSILEPEMKETAKYQTGAAERNQILNRQNQPNIQNQQLAPLQQQTPQETKTNKDIVQQADQEISKFPRLSDSISDESGNKYTQSQIDQLIGSPNDSNRRLGQNLQDRLLQKQKLEIAEIEFNQKKFIADRKYNSDTAKESAKKMNGIRESNVKKKFALQFARDAIESGEVGALSWANISERLGMPELQTAKGAQLLASAKENLLSNISKISAKGQNLWYEQMIYSMIPQIGQSKYANEVLLNFWENELNMDELLVNEFDRLAEEDEKKYGYVKSDIEARAHKNVQPQTEKIYNKSMYKSREIYENEKGFTYLQDNIRKKVPKGTYLTRQNAVAFMDKYGDVDKVLEIAKKMGYTIPSIEEVNEWE